MPISRQDSIIVKRPAGADDAARLRHEGEVLVAARHAGVVSLLELGEDASGPWITLADVGGPSLAAVLAAPPEGIGIQELARLVAAVATTAADLHDLGLVHGGIAANHVVLDGARRPVLCSLGRGGKRGQPPIDGGPALDTTQDVRALGALLEAVLPSSAVGGLEGDEESIGESGGRWGALAKLAEEAQEGERRRWPHHGGGLTARQLAAAIDKLVPVAEEHGRVLRRPGAAGRRSIESDGRDTRDQPTLLRLLVSAAALAALIIGGVGAAMLLSTPGRPSASPPRRPARVARAPVAAAAPAPVVPARSEPAAVPVGTVNYAGGVLTFGGARYTLGQAGDRVALGRWSCGDAVPAILETDGLVYVFDAWAAPDRDVHARLLSRVPGAGWLETQPRASRAGCDDLVVGGAPSGAVVLRPSLSS